MNKQLKPCPENGDVPLNVVSEIWKYRKGVCPLYGIQFIMGYSLNLSKQYNSIDLFKFIFAFGVIAIHTDPTVKYAGHWYRVL